MHIQKAKPIAYPRKTRKSEQASDMQQLKNKSDTATHHDWLCLNCLEALFEKENSKDFSGEWLEAGKAWSVLIAEGLMEVGVDLCIGLYCLILGVVWVLACLFEGFESDTRKHEAALHARDGLSRESRDAKQGQHKALMLERHHLLLQIDRIKDGMAFRGGHNNNANLDASMMHLKNAEARLRECEHKLSGVEGSLKYHKHGH